jgi:hypothetical protein
VACLVVSWNVIFDQLVWTAATEFTQAQVLRHQRGEPLTTIHDGFSPRVRDAAVRASLWTLPILAVGAVSVYVSFRRVR